MSTSPKRRLGPAANAHWLTDRLAVGGELNMFDEDLAADQLADIIEAGITHVVDLRAERRGMPQWPEHAGLVVRSAGVEDDGAPRSGEWFDAFVPWVVDVLAQPETKVLVHCAMGSNRGPSGAFAVLLMLGWEPGAALDLIQSQRPYAQIRYAEDACLWAHDRTRAGNARRSNDYSVISRWRTASVGRSAHTNP